ncbi:Interferon-induced protein 44-like [Mactra antiquata]
MSDNLRSKPWRKSEYLGDKTTSFEQKEVIRQRLKDNIINYKPLHELMPLHHTFPRVNILLFGAIGSGKSSVFNTISSVFKGKIFDIAPVGRSTSSISTKLTKFQVMYGGIAEQLRLTIWDTRGIDETHLMTSQTMKILLEGKLPDRYPLDPSSEVHLDSPGINTAPTLCDVVHCVSIIVDASTIDDMDDDIYQNIREMQTVMISSDVPYVIMLTNIDKICELTKADTTNAYKSVRIRDAVAKVAKKFGVVQTAVFFMKCYEEETFLDVNVDITALLALSGILHNCETYLHNFYETVIELSSAQSSVEEDNKTLKAEIAKLKGKINVYTNQYNEKSIERTKLKKAMEEKVGYGEKMLKIMEYGKMKIQASFIETEIVALRVKRDRLKMECTDLLNSPDL